MHDAGRRPPLFSRRRIHILCLAALLVAACSVPPEQSTLDEFFAAARLRDNTALRNLATVTFEPLEQGIVVEYEISSIASDQPGQEQVTITAPVRLPDGRISNKTLVVVLQHGARNGNPENARRWIVTGISEQRAGPD